MEISVLLLLVLPPLLWAGGTLIDRVLVNGDGAESSPEALMVFFGIFHLLAASAVSGWSAFSGETISWSSLLSLIANGVTHTAAIWIYMHALRNEESSRVAPWFQIIPALGLVGGFVFLRELLGWFQIGAIGLLMLGSWILAVKNGVVKHRLMWLMLASSLLLAINDVVFASFGRGAGTAAIAADMGGKAFWGLLFLASAQARAGFRAGLRTKFRLQVTGEVLALGADALFDWGKLFVPIAIVQATAGSAPLFVLAGAVLLTKYAPRILREELGAAAWRRLFGITLIVGGGFLLALTT